MGLGEDTRKTLSALWAPLLAITTIHDGRANGQIAVAGLAGSILPDAPRVIIGLWKANFTHDLILASGIFAAHLLPTGPDEARERALPLIETLGLRTGRDGDKMSDVAWHAGKTGAPILETALSYVEARVVATLDAEEMTLFLGDVVAGAALGDGEPLTWRAARQHIPQEWVAAFDANQERQRSEARRLRKLQG